MKPEFQLNAETERCRLQQRKSFTGEEKETELRRKLKRAKKRRKHL
jgi:hypothetical protein